MLSLILNNFKRIFKPLHLTSSMSLLKITNVSTMVCTFNQNMHFISLLRRLSIATYGVRVCSLTRCLAVYLAASEMGISDALETFIKQEPADDDLDIDVGCVDIDTIGSMSESNIADVPQILTSPIFDDVGWYIFSDFFLYLEAISLQSSVFPAQPLTLKLKPRTLWTLKPTPSLLLKKKTRSGNPLGRF